MTLLAKWLGLCFMVLLMALAPIASISARDLTTVEKASLAEIIERYNGLMKTQDWPAMVETTIPPRILNDMLKSSGATKEQLFKSIADIMAETMRKVTIQSYTIDLANADKRELGDGTPYVLIPTETIMSVDNSGRIAMRSSTLAMMDENEWYLMKVSDVKHVHMLVEVYQNLRASSFRATKWKF
jgi:hypothetical protein